MTFTSPCFVRVEDVISYVHKATINEIIEYFKSK